MVNYFKSSLLILAFLAINRLPSTAHPVEVLAANVNPVSNEESISNLIVSKTSSTSADISWTSNSYSSYQVTVRNLATQQVEQSFSTSSTSASINNLSPNNTYRIEVEENGFVIAEDVVM